MSRKWMDLSKAKADERWNGIESEWNPSCAIPSSANPSTSSSASSPSQPDIKRCWREFIPASSLYRSQAYGHLPGTLKRDKSLLSMAHQSAHPYEPYTRGRLPLPSAVPSSSSRVLQPSSSPNPHTTNLFSLFSPSRCQPSSGKRNAKRTIISKGGLERLSDKGGHHHQHHHQHHHLEMEEINTNDLAQKTSSELESTATRQLSIQAEPLKHRCANSGFYYNVICVWSAENSSTTSISRWWKQQRSQVSLQRLSAAIQRFNTIAFNSTLGIQRNSSEE